MKVTYIITSAHQYGGAQVHVRDLSKWMHDHGFDVTVMAGNPGIVSEKIIENGVKFKEIPDLGRSIHISHDIKSFFQTRRILKETRPDIVSCHSSKAGIIGRIAAWSLGIPVIFTAHGWAFTEGVSDKKRRLYALIERVCAKISKHIITVSRYDKFLALSKNVARSDHMTAIHNGMPYTAAINERILNDVPQLIMVARFAIPKDHTTLINALGQIKNKKWHLNLVGSGDDVPYQALVKSLDIENKVTFHGQRTDIDTYLLEQDVFLLVSDWEGFPRSIIEAMRASLPVITTRVGGCPESVSQFQSGYIVPKQDVQSLSAAISKLVDDPLRRRTMGEVGRSRYERYFTFDIMAYKTLNIYETALGRALSKPTEKQEQRPVSIASQ